MGAHHALLANSMYTGADVCNDERSEKKKKRNRADCAVAIGGEPQYFLLEGHVHPFGTHTQGKSA